MRIARRLGGGAALTLLVLALALPAAGAERPRAVDADDARGVAAAVVVAESEPLAFTGQILPVDAEGRATAPGDAPRQAEAVLDRLETLLEPAGASLDALVRLHVVAADQRALDAFRAALTARMAKRSGRPALTTVLGATTHPDALLALDAVAVAGGESPARSDGLAVLPSGVRVFVSGQAVEAPDLAAATRKTLAELDATLAHLGLDRSRVVQVKSFLRPMAESAAARREIERHFGDRPPPMVFVEWTTGPPIEIELVAAGGRAEASAPVVEYLTPPALKPSPVFSRVARVNRGALTFTGGLVGPGAGDGPAQTRAILDNLGTLMARSGSDLRHLVKATYYVADDAASQALNALRPDYYDPARPPAASKAPVPGVGDGRAIALDMIAVAAPAPNEGPPECGHSLTAAEAADGWIALFDGSTGFGWTGASVDAGLLGEGVTTGGFGRLALRAEVARAGTIEAGGRTHRVEPGRWELDDTGRRGPIRLGGGVAVRSLVARPLGLATVLDGNGLDGWEKLEHPRVSPGKRPSWTLANRALRVRGGPGALEYRGDRFGDCVIQVTARSVGRHANAGVFFRNQPGLLLVGYEAQVYNRCEDSDPARPSRYSTGAIDDRQEARRLVSRDFLPFTLTIVADGPHLATWVDGVPLTDWTDTRTPDDNPRRGLRLEPGTIQLQAHDPETDVEFRTVRAGHLGDR